MSTPHQSRVPVRTAGTLRRAVGASIDAIPILGAAAAATWAAAGQLGVAAPSGRFNELDALVDVVNGEPRIVLISLAALLAVTLVWHLVFGAALGASPGKLATGLRMVGPTGERVGAVRAIVHALLRPVSLALLGAGHLWSIADPCRRTLYDRVAGVLVVVPERAAAPELPSVATRPGTR